MISELNEQGIDINLEEQNVCECNHSPHSPCPSATMMVFEDEKKRSIDQSEHQTSQLRQWPIQLHLVPPNAPYFQGKDFHALADFSPPPDYPAPP